MATVLRVPSIVSHVDRFSSHRYEFTSDWPLPGAPYAAFAILRDLWSYPAWWPEFKRAEQITDDHGAFALRSILPLTLNFTLDREVEDESRFLLRAKAAGDITGTVEWALEQFAGGTTAHFVQRVTLDHCLAARLDFALRPALTWNHAAAMRSGHRGLTARLSDGQATS